MVKTVTIKRKYCDYCKRHDGAKDESGGRMGESGSTITIKVKKRKCGHDICNQCWWYPGMMKFCPKCGVGKAAQQKK